MEASKATNQKSYEKLSIQWMRSLALQRPVRAWTCSSPNCFMSRLSFFKKPFPLHELPPNGTHGLVTLDPFGGSTSVRVSTWSRAWQSPQGQVGLNKGAPCDDPKWLPSGDKRLHNY
jgi:hypothetical protein